jgi:hypothetical protein
VSCLGVISACVWANEPRALAPCERAACEWGCAFCYLEMI